MTKREKEIIKSRTERDCAKIKQRDCVHCKYFGSDTQVYYSFCNYLEITGMERPCIAGDCRKKGVFLEKRRRKKAK